MTLIEINVFVFRFIMYLGIVQSIVSAIPVGNAYDKHFHKNKIKTL